MSQPIDDLIERSKNFVSFDSISALSQLMSQMYITYNQMFNSLLLKYFLQIRVEDIRHRGDLTLVYHIFSHIFKETKDFKTKNHLLEVMKRISQMSRVSPDIKTLDHFYTNLINFYSFDERVYKQINESYGYYIKVNETQKLKYFSKIRQIFANILSLCSKQIPIGEYIKLGTRADYPRANTLLTHQKRFNEMTLKTKLNEWRNVSTFVKFNERKIWKYYKRISQNLENILYNSVVYGVTIFPDESPFNFDEKAHKLSPIVAITVHSPNSGQRLDNEFKVSKEDKNDFIALMKVTLTGNKTYGGSDYSTKCHYFDEKTNNWDIDGVIKSGISGPNGGCFMSHFSPIIIFRVIQHISTDYIFGVLVAVLMGVLIFGIMTVFFVQKKGQTLSLTEDNHQKQFTNESKNSYDYSYRKSYSYY